jgi:signal transduction histidine kinase
MTSQSNRGRVQRALAALYARAGPRVLLIAFAAVVVFGLPAALVIAEFEGRFLGWTWSQVISLLELWVPILFGIGAVGLFIRPDPWVTILRWGGPRARSPEHTWNALTAIRGAALRAIGVVLFVIPAPVVYEVKRFHERWYATGVLAVVDVVCMAAWTLFAIAVFELALRPVLEDVAAQLPESFEPRRDVLLRTKALLPLPVVTMFAGLLVGAYANASSDGSARLAIAAGLALVTAAVATGMQLIINRSLLSPIDDLLAATKRIRSGDLDHPVPLISTDELGALAHSFNEMQAGLRQRESLRTELEASRARIVAVADAERRRMERDLHDGAQQHLVLVSLKLGQLSRMIEQDPPAALGLVAELRDDVTRAQSELRDLAHGIYPQSLEQDGLRAALDEAVARSPIRAALDCDGIARYSPEVEAAVYFCCLEAFQNAAKHAGPGASARIELRATNDGLTFAVIDDGAGFDPAASSGTSGLQNMADRIGALGGSVDIVSTPGSGTTVAGRVPVGGH